MWTFSITLFVIVISTSLIAPNEGLYCKKDNGYEICGFSHITLVKPPTYEEYYFTRGCVAENNCQKSAPNVSKTGNSVSPMMISSPEICPYEIIDSMPELFHGPSITELTVDCVEFAPKFNLFKDLVSLENLGISNIEFTKLPENFLSYLPKLRKLHLVYVKILTITPHTFSGINLGLRELHLMFNNLTVVEDKSFQKFDNLEELYIQNNNLTKLSSGMFDGLNALKKLTVQGNHITVLRSDTFSKLSNLEDVDLSMNEIHTIEAETFSGLPIHSIRLSDNGLEDLSVGMFKNLPNVRVLLLDINQIDLIGRNVFEGLGKGVDLDLRHNMIQYIEPYAFQDMNISNLYLNHNCLNAIEPDTFNGLHISGKIMDLSNNKITEIKDQAFRNLTVNRETCIVLPFNIIDIFMYEWGVNDSISKIVNELWKCPYA